jgi:NAD-dependent DNA ligase
MSSDLIDENGTPAKRLYAGRVHDRLVAEMLGLVKGMICDGVLTDGEAVALHQWLRSHPDVTVGYPGNLIAERLQAAFADGILEEHERTELLDLMRSLAGETDDQSGLLNRATRLPCDNPPPTVFFDGREFCLTGIFAYGARKACEAEITARGGRCAKSPTQHTHYLVIGLEASAAWVQGDHGTKIEHAVKLKSNGHPISILAEEHWIEALQYES